MALYKEHSALQKYKAKMKQDKNINKRQLTLVQMCFQQPFEDRHRYRLSQLNWQLIPEPRSSNNKGMITSSFSGAWNQKPCRIRWGAEYGLIFDG